VRAKAVTFIADYRPFTTPKRAGVFGFWTAAIVLCSIFGFGHSNNPGESPFGLFAVGLFGLTFIFSLCSPAARRAPRAAVRRHRLLAAEFLVSKYKAAPLEPARLHEPDEPIAKLPRCEPASKQVNAATKQISNGFTECQLEVEMERTRARESTTTPDDGTRIYRGVIDSTRCDWHHHLDFSFQELSSVRLNVKRRATQPLKQSPDCGPGADPITRRPERQSLHRCCRVPTWHAGCSRRRSAAGWVARSDGRRAPRCLCG